MSTFPSAIRILISERETGRALPNIVVQLKLYASRKNDYNFILPISDKNGYINVTKDWIKTNIVKEQALFVMDYSSGLDDCKPYVEVTVLDSAALIRAVDAMHIYQKSIGISNDEIDKYREAENLKFYPWSKIINLGEETLEINILLESK